MFGVSSSSPTVDFKHRYVAAVDGGATKVNRGRNSPSRTTVVVCATLAVGASVLIGGRLLYSSSCRTDKDGESKAAPAAPAEAAPSWWQRARSRLRLSASAEDDDDDVFTSGTGAANLFDEEKTKARQLSKDKSKVSVGAGAATTSAPLHKLEKSGSFTKVGASGGTTTGFPSDIQEREQHIKLVRALLRRQAGISYSDDDSSTSSDSTDVSLNYHFATTMEATARDDLLMAFAAYDDYNDRVAVGHASLGKSLEEEAEVLQADILVKTLEYLDMSNEREKLRCRRIALHREQGRTTPTSSIDAAGGGTDEDVYDPINMMYRQLAPGNSAQRHYQQFNGELNQGEDNVDAKIDSNFPSLSDRQARQFQATFGPSMMRMGPSVGGDMNTDDSVLDRILGQASAAAARSSGHVRSTLPGHPATAHGNGSDNDMMEDEWEDDDGAEADFMDYLQQPDDAAHFYSRTELRQARRDPGNDVRVVGLDDDDFGLHSDGGAKEDDWEYDGDDEEGEEAEENMMASEPWSRQDKADFEQELFGRIHQLASTYTLTAAMAEKEANEEDARKLAERVQRRRQQLQKLGVAHKTSAAGGAPQPATSATEDDEEWEDEDEDEEA
ncbi:hypothetical protein ABL78_1068 [Leptomonas seymouri]|uniref:Uncharacterized protein n=1 Tax=Leptomonas seymouri TaxID=5684 RepID=A0A0N1I7X5_LEPSE|nr:hypothetical protein ABL78_1068 [Leptomonas seymouri]|eukprot:KPI89805.1 hypothetical protein ABL78_1068 [Leptomonas seymouri]